MAKKQTDGSTKAALVTDTHFGARGDDVALAEAMTRFWRREFWPRVKAEGITRVVHLGDIVDRRKNINYSSLTRLRDDFLEPAAILGVAVDVLTGNHDVYYRDTNQFNALGTLLNTAAYRNVESHWHPATIEIGKTAVLLLPWINPENRDESMEAVTATKAQVLFAHLELKGFEMYRGQVAKEGMDAADFSKFDIVLSGHYHTPSQKGNVRYLGAPYDMTWADYGDARGFHIFDGRDRSVEFIENPNWFHRRLVFDHAAAAPDVSDLEGCSVKVVVKARGDGSAYDRLMADIAGASPARITVLEESAWAAPGEGAAVDGIDIEDTARLLATYVGESSVECDKPALAATMSDLYSRAMGAEAIDG